MRRLYSVCDDVRGAGLSGPPVRLKADTPYCNNLPVKVLIDISIVPLGVGLSLSPYIAACEKVFTDAGLKTALHAYGTNVEGEWDEVFGAVKKCHEMLHGMGAPRISTNMRLGTRTDRAQTMEDKVQSVIDKL
jgi:uncharacterized protein (TIGR00106 family)